MVIIPLVTNNTAMRVVVLCLAAGTVQARIVVYSVLSGGPWKADAPRLRAALLCYTRLLHA